MYLLAQKVVRTDAATHAVPAWKMSTQGKTGRKKNLKNQRFYEIFIMKYIMKFQKKIFFSPKECLF